MLNQPTIEKLQVMKLHGMANAFQERGFLFRTAIAVSYARDTPLLNRKDLPARR